MNILLIGGTASLTNKLIVKFKKEKHKVYLITGQRYKYTYYEKVYERFDFPYDGESLGEIFRLGRLVGRASDGVFQNNPETNAFYLLMKAFAGIGAAPESAVKEAIDLMPIDVAAEEVLALKDSKDAVYHIMSHMPPTLEEVLKDCAEGIQIVSDEEFAQILETKASTLERELAGVLQNQWQIMRTKHPVIRVTNELTIKALKEAGYEPKIPAPKQILKGFN